MNATIAHEPDGHFHGEARVQAGTLYRFRLDRERRLYPDPASRFQPDGPHGPSEIVDPMRYRSPDGWRVRRRVVEPSWPKTCIARQLRRSRSMNAVELLKKQHREVDSLIKQFEKAKGDDEKEGIFLEIAARLVAHDAIEREIFYPACENVLGKNEPLMEGIAEHDLIEFSIFRADRARGSDSFEYLVSVLAEMVEHHVDEEEKEVLPKASRKMSDDMLERLGTKMLERFEEAMAGDFRRALRRNLEQVIAGRAKPTPPKRAAARTTMIRKRPERAASRPKAAARTKRTARGKRSARAR